MSAPGVEAVDRGIADENVAGAALAARGWAVTPFGQRMWDPRTCPQYGRRGLIVAVRSTTGALRHAPDLLAGRGGDVRFVEVVRNRHDDTRCMELAKLAALDRWAWIAPVYLVDVEHWSTWRHPSGEWPYAVVSDASTRTRVGTGDPYAWQARHDEAEFDDVFGQVTAA